MPVGFCKSRNQSAYRNVKLKEKNLISPKKFNIMFMKATIKASTTTYVEQGAFREISVRFVIRVSTTIIHFTVNTIDFKCGKIQTFGGFYEYLTCEIDLSFG